ncbi:hypothetical protein HHL16_14890 [Pseudoflavitalea sp. G-6-1-2]|uniref:hypothetical protein n=1 Tax=Pseudoflavitalea sp. G-6-1-2 TaxID=2728841 RepID=UPI00146A03DE|nr:hypothetical protein [Pseudoflavitalea sp. G-6-1-2]NML22167.1 hypothetical protein [Pseudoflavitalea sp. G-6-1-2]
MLKQFFVMAALSAIPCAGLIAQNTNPWPATGKVGIGTTTPLADLHIHDTSNATLIRLSNPMYYSEIYQAGYNTTIKASAGFETYFGNTNPQSYFRLGGTSTGTQGKIWFAGVYGAFINGYQGFKIGHGEKYGFYTNGTTGQFYGMGAVFTNNDNWGLSFFSKNATVDQESIRITSTGRVGINTINPATQLHVNGNATVNNILYGDTTHANLLLSKTGGSKLSWGTDASLSQVMCGGPVTLWTAGVERFRVNPNGAIGVGTSSPGAMFHVKGTIKFETLTENTTPARVIVSDVNGNLAWRDAAGIGGSANSWTLDGATVGAIKNFGTTDNFDLPFITNNTEKMRIKADGSVTIGTAAPRGMLAVNGDVYAKKVKITATGWADYVFADDYKLPSLKEVEAFIRKNKHLPEVPTAAEIEKNGADVGETQVTLLKKVEEMTLYIIEQQKQIEQMKASEKVTLSVIEQLKRDMEELKKAKK